MTRTPRPKNLPSVLSHRVTACGRQVSSTFMSDNICVFPGGNMRCTHLYFGLPLVLSVLIGCGGGAGAGLSTSGGGTGGATGGNLGVPNPPNATAKFHVDVT